MKRIMWVILLLAIALPAIAKNNPVEVRRGDEGDGWILSIYDSNIGTSAELITSSTSFAQISAADLVEATSADIIATNAVLIIRGINNSSDKIYTEALTLNGATAVTSAITFKYVDQIWLDIETTGAVSIRKETGDVEINEIATGKLVGNVAQHFAGNNRDIIVQEWSVQNTSGAANIKFELRWYPDDADCLDSTDGFIILDEIVATSSGTHNVFNPPIVRTFDRGYEDGIKCERGGWLAVFGLAGETFQTGIVTIKGYDK